MVQTEGRLASREADRRERGLVEEVPWEERGSDSKDELRRQGQAKDREFNKNLRADIVFIALGQSHCVRSERHGRARNRVVALLASRNALIG